MRASAIFSASFASFVAGLFVCTDDHLALL
uniref:Uncharacterized protein n=1 Tax=Anguilla anguilla TaxID=7936 RepID=A0A0E9PLR2_ANGAN